MHRCHAYCCFLIAAVVWSRHNAIYSSLERERVARQDQITIAEGTSLTAVALRKRKSNHVILLQTETVVSPIDPNQG